MTKNILYIAIAAAILSQPGCSQNSGDTASCYSEKLSDKDKVLTGMLNNPHFKGGNDSLVNFLNTNISFEQLINDFSKNDRFYGDTARIKFIVSKQGNLSNLSVKLAKKELFADEIERVIKKSSCNWIAGRTDQLANGWVQFDIYFLVERSNSKVKTTMTFNEYVPAN